MPCFNAALTLPRALASLYVQTYANWECVIVDDGSTDDSAIIVKDFGDPRLQLIQNSRNLGRGRSRQIALDHARGQYLTFLDADDWLFPTKLGLQVDALDRDGELSVVSAALAVEDDSGNFIGIRGRPNGGAAPQEKWFSGLRRPPFPYVAAMVRMDLAKATGYRPELRRAQDLDFFLRLTADKKFAVLSDPLYAYSEGSSYRKTEVVASLRFERQVFLQQRSQQPIAALRETAKLTSKLGVYHLAFALGRERDIIQRRSATPTHSDREAYAHADAMVRRALLNENR